MDEDGRHRDEHEDGQHRHVEDEQVKVLVVVEADAIVEPRAKVVHLEHAPPEHLAKVRAVGLVDVGLRLAADAPRAVVLHLERVQLRDERARLGVLRADDPRVGDASRIGEDGAHEGDHAEREDGVEGDRVRDALAPCADRGRRVVQQQREDVIREDEIAPADEREHEEDGEPAAELSAGAHAGGSG